MNYYLVDYENVKSHGLDGVVKMTPEDVVCIFYSENADSMTFALHRKLNETTAHVIYEKVEVGTKNALDFQLVTELGYLIRDLQGQDVSFFIVSKDKGYGNTVTYWKKRGVRIAQVIDVSGQDEQKIESDLKAKVEPLVKDKDVVDKVVKMILQYKTKQGINNALMKEFPSRDNKRSSEIYSAIKPLLSDKKGDVNAQAAPAPEKAEMPKTVFESRKEEPKKPAEEELMKATPEAAAPAAAPETAAAEPEKEAQLTAPADSAEQTAVLPDHAEQAEKAPEKASEKAAEKTSEKPKKKAGRPRKNSTKAASKAAGNAEAPVEAAAEPEKPVSESGKAEQPVKKSTRSRKPRKTQENSAANEPVNDTAKQEEK